MNEVNSANPSHLNGWIEVAGKPAQVITANPAGITCDGCGFINTPQATLSTGTPILNRGNLDGYRVGGGQVQIEGLGLDGRQVDALTVLTRSAEINAAIWAKRLNVVTGTNEVTVDANGQPTQIAPIIISPFPQNFSLSTTSSQTKDNTAPVFALDVGYLGGMYAGHIFLVGSEHGLGVRDNGTLQATQQLTLDSNGILSLTDKGKITAPELTIKTAGAIDNSGAITSQRSATIETNSTLTNTGTIASQQRLSITSQALTNTRNSDVTSITNTTTASSGLIDGQTVLINSPRIENLGDARIYGDHLILQADTLINAGETINDISHSPVIATRRHLAMGVGTLDNRDGGLIFSGGNLTVGRTVQSTIDPTTGDTRYTTTGFANRINNDSATIDVLGDVFIQAIALANRNTHLQIDQVPEAAFSVQRLQPAGSNTIYPNTQCGNRPGIFSSSLRLLCSGDGRRETFEDYTLYRLTGTPSRSQVVTSKPAVFRVGGNFSFNGDGSASSQLTNQDSQIIVGGDIHLNDTALNNQETKGAYSVQYSGTAEYTTVEWCGSWPSESHCRKWHGQFAYNPAPEVTTIDLPTGQRYVGNTNQSSGSGGNSTTNTPVPIPALPGGANGTNSALFTLTANPQSPGGYLIETDPRFTSYRQWQSSDYLLNKLAVDPATTQKRIGDGFYEQSLIRDQITQFTGRRFLPGYTDDELQYLALMNNATTVAQKLELRPGIALSAEQVALLTSDIVWLVTQAVTLPDGSTTEVLVPKVYARIKEGDLQADGTLISGRAITARLQGDLTNSGQIAADQNVVVTAENIHNLKGSIDGRDVRLYADVDINNLGGRIAAADRLKLQAGRDLNVQSTTQTTEAQLSAKEAAQGNRFTRTQVDRVAGIYVTGADTAQSTTAANANTENTLNLTAGRNITLRAAQIQNTTSGTTTITAGEHLQITTVTTGQDDKAVKDANNHSHIAHREEVGTQISISGALELSAKQDLTLRAATVTSGGEIDAQAGNNLRIEAGQSETLNDQARKTTHRGTLSRTTTTTRDRFEDSNSVVSTLSGNSVNTSAANDITVQGSNVVADKDVRLTAGRDLNIVASTNTHEEDHYQHKTKSGVFGSGGVGVTIGKRTQSTDQQTTRTTSSASTVGSLDGNIELQAGRIYTQTGSDVIALGQNNTTNTNSNNSPTNTPTQTTGDITITARQVSITEAREASRTVTETQFKQTGVTVAFSAPVITAAQTVEQMGQAAGNTSDPRMKALAAASAGMAINTAADAIKKNPDQLGGVNLSISVGSSKAQSQSTSTTDTSAPSQLVAANNLSIKAVSEDLTVQGSQLKAVNTVTLQAEKELNLQAARDSAEQHSTNRNQSASIGVGFAGGAKQSGVSLNLAASQGRGNADGSDVAWFNTEVIAGQQIKTESGNDTTIRGGVLTAPQVTVEAGTNGNGNLTIESLQDTSQYKSQQKQHGRTLSVPIAGGKPSGSINATHSNIESDYASVNQQSGIRAGDEGFQVNVKGNTTLTGGAITSTQTAVDQGKNTFRTEGTLTTTDINNKAGYEAKSVGVNLGVGYSASGNLAPQGTGVGLGSDSDRQSSTTQAAISDIAGNKAARTGYAETGLVNRFDAERVQKEINAQTQITQTFGTYAAKAVGDYAQSQLNQANNLKAEADQLGTSPEDRQRALQLRTEAKQIEDQWGEGGSYRIALHTLTGGLSGGLSGALGGAATATAAPLLNDLQVNLSKTLKQAGASDEAADGIAQGISTVTAAGIGASVGMASGNGLAGAATAVNIDANNRQLHLTEAQKLAELKRGKSAEQAHRLDAASCALVRCADGVPTDDPNYRKLQALQNEGKNYQEEQAALRKTGAFVYEPGLDTTRDLITEHGEAKQRIGGGVNLVAGSVGTVGGAAITGAGVLGCGPSAGMSCALIPVGGYVASVSYEQAQEGSNALLGPYQSTEGARVLGSFDPLTYPGERDPLKEVGLDAAKLGMTALAGKFIPKTLAKSEGLEVPPAKPSKDLANNAVGSESKVTTIVVDSKGNVITGDWSSTKRLSGPENALEHWEKHKTEFPQYKNASQYTEGAQNFITNPPSSTLTKVRANGDTVMYDPGTNTFAIKAASGAPRTMFKPDPANHGYATNLDYFNAQK